MTNDKIVTKTNIKNITHWLDYPVKPEDHISGDPKCKLNIIRTKGALTPVHQAMVLTIEPSTFRYRFERDESWIVLEGKVRIELEDGEVVNMETGDMVSILGGRNSTWQVFESFKKFVVITSAEVG